MTHLFELRRKGAVNRPGGGYMWAGNAPPDDTKKVKAQEAWALKAYRKMMGYDGVVVGVITMIPEDKQEQQNNQVKQ